jgi:DNA-binding transcriptional ArsR family regulator
VDAALRAIVEPTRREILRLVWDAERTAGDIASHFAVSRAAVSQHLRVLREADLLTERRDGTRRLYRARPERIEELRAWLDDYWATGLDALKGAAEWDEERRKRRGGTGADRD